MTLLVHITSQEIARKISKNGINKGVTNGFVYFMPISFSHYISHQWMRELKRSGIKNFSAVYFKLNDDAMVWHGYYNANHENEPLSIAVGKFMRLADQQGYEFYVSGRINKGSITKISNIKKIMGWRYHPKAHGIKPCNCPACLMRGEYSSAKRRKAWNDENEKPKYTTEEARVILSGSNDIDEIYVAMWIFGKKYRQDDPQFLFRVFDFNDEILSSDGVKILSKFKHPKAKAKLIEFSKGDNADLAEYALQLLKERNWI
jgi:hypothetical protein